MEQESFYSKCELCNRYNILNFHHFIPKYLHSNKWVKKNFTREQMSEGINICKKDCHRELHKMISNKQLAKHFNSKEKILSHDKFNKYIKWIKNRKI